MLFFQLYENSQSIKGIDFFNILIGLISLHRFDTSFLTTKEYLIRSNKGQKEQSKHLVHFSIRIVDRALKNEEESNRIFCTIFANANLGNA